MIQQFYDDWSERDRDLLSPDSHSVVLDLYEKDQWTQLVNYCDTCIEHYEGISDVWITAEALVGAFQKGKAIAKKYAIQRKLKNG